MTAFASLIIVAIVATVALLSMTRRRQPGTARIGLHVSSVTGKGITMPDIERPKIQLLDTEKVELSISAKDAGGARLPASDYAWSSSNPSVIALEELEDNPYARVARTPEPGSAVITVVHTPSGSKETLPIDVVFSEPGEIGLSAGTPTLE